MKVDSNGNPVSEGTYGLMGGIAAKVIRTFVDPTVDSAEMQEIIADGGYIVDLGSEGHTVCSPDDFTAATHANDVVIAQDGQEVKPGDTVLVEAIYAPGNKEGPFTVMSTYPLGTLQGSSCYTLKEFKGSGPDGYWFMQWGTCKKVVEKVKAISKGIKASSTDILVPEVGDRVRIIRTDKRKHNEGELRYAVIGTVQKVEDIAVKGSEALATVLVEEITEGTVPPHVKVGKVTQFWLTRIAEILGTKDTDQLTETGDDMATENKKKETKFGKVEVVREGTQIILPERMGLRTAIEELTRQAAQEEMDVNVKEHIPGFCLDAAHAFVQALAKEFGWVNALPTPGFFGPTPPTMIGVTVDPEGTTVPIPWGKIGIPGLSGTLQTGIDFIDKRPVFCIQGTVKQRDKELVSRIAKMTKDYLKEHSLYKMKAIRVKFPEEGEKFSPLDHQPKFISTTDVRPEELIFSRDVEKQVRVNIWTPIQSLAAVKAAKVPLKRGVLLYGRYGVGKTLLASITARMAVQAGITFMDLEDSSQLPEAVQFARTLGGMVVIFAEDIDRCDKDGERTDAFNEILNTVDGLTSKTDEVLIVYTTNHVEKISKAMLRQGRIDKVIHIKEPDAEAAQRLVRLYARHMLRPEEDITEVGELLSGFIPAAIREVVEQSKLAAIERGDTHYITAEDLRVTAENTREHMELLREAPKDDRSELEKLGDAVGMRIATTLAQSIDVEGDPEQDIRGSIGLVTRRKVA